MTPSTAKKPRTGGSQQPACTHTEHDILSTTEAACNLYDKLVQWRWFHRITWCVFIKGHSYNLCDAASQDVCPNGVPALVEGGNNDSDWDSE